MEPHRARHDPIVEIFSTTVVDGILLRAEAYDLANRRWYRVDVRDATSADPKWLVSTLTRRLRQHHDVYAAAPPWNTLVVADLDGEQFLTQIRPPSKVDREIRRALVYGGGQGRRRRKGPDDSQRPDGQRLPTIRVDALRALRYLCRSADRCSWEGRECVFKRIEFDLDVGIVADEIRAREAALQALRGIRCCDGRAAGKRDDADKDMMRRFFSLVPILAVVVATRPPWPQGTVAGILTPYAGRDLEVLLQQQQQQHGELPLTMTHLRALTRGVANMARFGVVHGDIRYWNTVFEEEEEGQEDRLLLIDAGTIAPGGYEGDARALGSMMLWCLRHAPRLRECRERRVMVVAAVCALAEGDFAAALSCLSTKI
ncbi:hypothetical protein PWT90_07343 [Aphanocladium album]|nr:hypothetical protein PWT90_07343 [Aphanocladium album]